MSKYQPEFTDKGNSKVDDLIADAVSIVSENVTVASGRNLTRGTVLGKITASGKVVAVDNAAADGSQTPYAILAEDADATSADVVTTAYLKGSFNEDALTFGGDDTAADHRVALRDLGIYLKSPVSR